MSIWEDEHIDRISVWMFVEGDIGQVLSKEFGLTP